MFGYVTIYHKGLAKPVLYLQNIDFVESKPINKDHLEELKYLHKIFPMLEKQ